MTNTHPSIFKVPYHAIYDSTNDMTPFHHDEDSESRAVYVNANNPSDAKKIADEKLHSMYRPPNWSFVTGEASPVTSEDIQKSEKIIELDEIKRIRYVDEGDKEAYNVHCILDWEKGEWEGCGWSMYERDYMGTRWFGPYGLDDEAEKQIRSVLEPVAKKLGIELKSGSLAGTNVHRLVEGVAVAKMPFERRKMRIPPGKDVDVEVYLMDLGEVVLLKETDIF